MVLNVVAAEVAPGKMKEAREWSEKMAEFAKKRFGVDVETLIPVTSGPGMGRRLIWTIRFDSLAAWADFHAKELEDTERNARVREAFDEKQYFVSAHRTLYRTP
jgi:hypothetical protein